MVAKLFYFEQCGLEKKTAIKKTLFIFMKFDTAVEIQVRGVDVVIDVVVVAVVVVVCSNFSKHVMK